MDHHIGMVKYKNDIFEKNSELNKFAESIIQRNNIKLENNKEKFNVLNKLIQIYCLENKKELDYYEKKPEKLATLFSITYISSYIFSIYFNSLEYDDELLKTFAQIISLLVKKIITISFLICAIDTKTKSNILSNHCKATDISIKSLPIVKIENELKCVIHKQGKKLSQEKE